MDDREQEKRAGEDVERFRFRAVKELRAEIGDAVVLKSIERAGKISGAGSRGVGDSDARHEQDEEKGESAKKFHIGENASCGCWDAIVCA